MDDFDPVKLTINVSKHEDEFLNVHEKLSKCYSKEDYEEFQIAVETIVKKTLGHDDGKNVIRPFINDMVRDFLAEQAWKSKQFWIPIIIAIIGVLVAFFKQ